MTDAQSPGRHDPSPAEKLILRQLLLIVRGSSTLNPLPPGCQDAAAQLAQMSRHWNADTINKWLRDHRHQARPDPERPDLPDSPQLFGVRDLSPPSTPGREGRTAPLAPSSPDIHSSDAPVEARPRFADAVHEIVTSLFARLRVAPDTSETIPNQLVQFIADQLSARLLPQAEELALEIASNCQGKIRELFEGPVLPSAQKLHLREARIMREHKRRERVARGAELTRVRLEAAERAAEAESRDPAPLTALLDEEVAAEEFHCSDPAARTYEEYSHELLELLQIPWGRRNRRRFTNYPLSVKLAFLLACHSRPGLDIVRQFIPLPSYETVQKYYEIELRTTERGLSDLALLGEQIRLSTHTTSLPRGSFVSIAVDAMAMNPDRSYLPANHCDNEFVIYVQPLDRRYSCWPLHVMPHPNGRATSDVFDAVKQAREALSVEGLIVKFECSDGDAGHNQSHRDFFREWYPHFIEKGLEGALDYAGGRDNIPVGDFLHLVKTFLNKVKNHMVVMSPDCLQTAVDVKDLESLLHLGRALSDRSSVGRMRDSYALQLFSIPNCLRCLSAGQMNEFMFLLPWALQEEVIRAPELSRKERLMKAVLSLKLLLHYFDLSSLPRAKGVTQRFSKAETEAVTFAEDSVWPRILNSALALVLFVLQADEHWSFSRMGTHCLENFFGLVRRSSLGDDRSVTAMRVIVRASLVARTIHELKIVVKHRGRDNVGGVVINGDLPLWDESVADRLYRSLVFQCNLEIVRQDPPMLGKGDLLKIFGEWANRDHHDHDPAYHAKFDATAANCRISARIIARSGFLRELLETTVDETDGADPG
jgi:hypothetical protein